MRKRFAFAIVLATTTTIGSSVGQTPPYHALVLDSIQAQHGAAMNRWGQVTGTSGSGALPGGNHAVLWTPNVANDGFSAGHLFSIESSPGLPAGTTDTFPSGLNDRGQVVGTAFTPGQGDGNQTQSWMWRPQTLNNPKGVLHGNQGTAVTFPLLSIPGLGTLAEYNNVINNQGIIAARGINFRALLWTPDTQNGLSGVWTYDPDHGVGPTGINDAGQLAGSSCQDSNWNGPYLHKGTLPLVASDLLTSPLWIAPNAGECVGGAGGINTRGDLAISAVSTSNMIRAYLYKKGEIKDISTGFASQGWAINNYDQVVGQVDADTRRAYLFENGKAFDLNQLADTTNGLFLRQSLAVNDAGQILSVGVFPGVGSATVLLTPQSLVTNPITITLGVLKNHGSTYKQTLRITNHGSASMPGPIAVALDNLTPGVTLTNATGTTFYTRPGSVYADVSPATLAAGATTPSFTLVFSNPNGTTIKYKPRALQSRAPR